MRALAKLSILVILFAICLPAHGDILIYNKIMNCWSATETGGEWSVEKERVKGYVILEVTYDPNGIFETIDDAIQLEYYRNSEGKWYETVDHDFIYTRVVEGSNVEWVLLESTIADPNAEMLMLTGRARNTRIGFADPNEAAKSLDGDFFRYEPAVDNDVIQTCDWSLRLNKPYTRWSNFDSLNSVQTYEVLVTILVNRGYDELE